MSTVYTDSDPFVCAWTRNLINAGEIPHGEVLELPIQQLTALQLRGATQVHCFNGVSGWPYALKLAGWPATASVWSGSCPCQSFSTAGRRKGFDDERHLWPEWFRLIRECRPLVVLGEQVPSPDGLKWFDLVSSDLEEEGYAVAALDIPAGGVGAPHLRQRLYFAAIAMAESDRERRERLRLHLRAGRSRQAKPEAWRRREALGMANAAGVGSARESDAGRQEVARSQHAREAVELADSAGEGRRGPERAAQAQPQAEVSGEPRRPSLADAGELGDASGEGSGRDAGAVSGAQETGEREGVFARRLSHESVAAGAVRGFWSPAEWVACYDPRTDGVVYRPVEPGLEPVASGLPARVGRLRGYGNALCAPLAATFVRSVMEVLCGKS